MARRELLEMVGDSSGFILEVCEGPCVLMPGICQAIPLLPNYMAVPIASSGRHWVQDGHTTGMIKTHHPSFLRAVA